MSHSSRCEGGRKAPNSRRGGAYSSHMQNVLIMQAVMYSLQAEIAKCGELGRSRGACIPRWISCQVKNAFGMRHMRRCAATARPQAACCGACCTLPHHAQRSRGRPTRMSCRYRLHLEGIEHAARFMLHVAISGWWIAISKSEPDSRTGACKTQRLCR